MAEGKTKRSFSVASFRAVAQNLMAGYTAYSEEQRIQDVKRTIRLAVSDATKAIHESDSADLEGVENNVVHSLCSIMLKEVKSFADYQNRMRKAEQQMDFMQGQLERRDELINDQREQLLQEISRLNEAARMAQQKHTELLDQFRSLQRKMMLQKATAAISNQSSSQFRRVSTASELSTTVSPTNFSVSQFGVTDPSGLILDASLYEPVSQMNVPQVDVPVISNKLESEYASILQEEEYMCKEKSLRFEAEQKLKGLQLRLKQEQQEATQKTTKRMEDLLKVETNKLESRVRQLEFQLQRKEEELETVQRTEREKWKSMTENVAATQKAQNAVIVKKWITRMENLQMELADVEAQGLHQLGALKGDRDKARQALQYIQKDMETMKKENEKYKKESEKHQGETKKQMEKMKADVSKKYEMQIKSLQETQQNDKAKYEGDIEQLRVKLREKEVELNSIKAEEIVQSSANKTRGVPHKPSNVAALESKGSSANIHLEKQLSKAKEDLSVKDEQLLELQIKYDDIKGENECNLTELHNRTADVENLEIRIEQFKEDIRGLRAANANLKISVPPETPAQKNDDEKEATPVEVNMTESEPVSTQQEVKTLQAQVKALQAALSAEKQKQMQQSISTSPEKARPKGPSHTTSSRSHIPGEKVAVSVCEPPLPESSGPVEESEVDQVKETSSVSRVDAQTQTNAQVPVVDSSAADKPKVHVLHAPAPPSAKESKQVSAAIQRPHLPSNKPLVHVSKEKEPPREKLVGDHVDLTPQQKLIAIEQMETEKSSPPKVLETVGALKPWNSDSVTQEHEAAAEAEDEKQLVAGELPLTVRAAKPSPSTYFQYHPPVQLQRPHSAKPVTQPVSGGVDQRSMDMMKKREEKAKDFAVQRQLAWERLVIRDASDVAPASVPSVPNSSYPHPSVELVDLVAKAQYDLIHVALQSIEDRYPSKFSSVTETSVVRCAHHRAAPDISFSHRTVSCQTDSVNIVTLPECHDFPSQCFSQGSKSASLTVINLLCAPFTKSLSATLIQLASSPYVYEEWIPRAVSTDTISTALGQRQITTKVMHATVYHALSKLRKKACGPQRGPPITKSQDQGEPPVKTVDVPLPPQQSTGSLYEMPPSKLQKARPKSAGGNSPKTAKSTGVIHEAVYHPRMMTRVPEKLPERNNPYTMLKTLAKDEEPTIPPESMKRAVASSPRPVAVTIKAVGPFMDRKM